MGDRMVVGLIFCGTGFAFLITWLSLFLIWKKQMSYNTEVWAKVILIERVYSRQQHTYVYYPHYAFDFRGETYEVVSSIGTTINRRRRGETVKLFIDENNPIHFRVGGSKVLQILWIVFLSLGILFFLIGISFSLWALFV